MTVHFDRADRLREVEKLAVRYGARIIAHGKAWRVVGPHHDLLTSDPAMLTRLEMQPMKARR